MLNISNVRITDLKFAPYNPRKWNGNETESLTKSITRFGLVDPLIVNSSPARKNIVIGGHFRLKIAKDLKYKNVPVVYVDIPDVDREKELNLRLNKNLGEFDYDLLKNFDIELLKDVGFDDIDIDEIIGLKMGQTDPDDVPEVNEITPEAKKGDIYQLGPHRVMCGDSTKENDVKMLMNGKLADMVFTDPPYGISYADKNKYLNSISKGNKIQRKIINDHKDICEMKEEIIYPAFCLMKSILNKRASYYITAPQGGDLLMMMMEMMNKAGLTLRHMLIWVKNNHVLGRTDYNYKHEPILYGWINVHDFYGMGDYKFSAWDIDKPLKSDLHPTMKPVKLIENAILNSSKREDIIADIFLGSGSTVIACEQTNRICLGLEIDPVYVDVTVKRWENYTGKKAGKLS